MKVFSEDTEKLESGVLGTSLVIRISELQLTSGLKELAESFRERCGDIKTAFDFGFVSSIEPPFGLYCTCHGHVEGSKVTHFRLALQRKPTTPPPKSLEEVSKKLGGYKEGWPRLLAALEGQKADARAEYQAAVVDRNKWALRINKRRLPGSFGDLKFEAEELGFSNTNRNSKVTIGFEKGESIYVVRIRSQIPVIFKPDFFEDVAALLWQELNPLLKADEPY